MPKYKNEHINTLTRLSHYKKDVTISSNKRSVYVGTNFREAFCFDAHLTQGGGKMKKRHTFFLFVTVVFIFFSAQAFAFGPHEKERPRGKFRNYAGEVMEALQLTADQKDNLHVLCEKSRETVDTNWKKLEELQARLSESVLAGTGASGEGYEETVNQIAELRAQMVKNRLENWIQFVEILDSEQKEILSGRMKELRKKRPKQRMHLKRYFPFP